MFKSKGWLSCMLVVALFAAIPARGQDQKDMESAVSKVVATAKIVWAHGESARPILQQQRRSHKKSTGAVRVLRRQLRGTKPKDGSADIENITVDCLAFVNAVEKLVDMGLDAAPVVEKAAEALDDDKIRDLLNVIERPWYDAMANKALTPFVGRGTFDGMFKSLLAYKSNLAPAFLRIFKDSEKAVELRLVAGEGVAQFSVGSTKKEQARVIAELKNVQVRPNEAPQIKEKAITSLCRLGDSSLFDRLVKTHLGTIANEKKKGAPGTSQVSLVALQQLIHLHQEIKAYRRTAQYFAEFLRQILTVPMEQWQPAGHRQIAINCYNFACVLSRIKETEFGMWALEESFNYGYNSWDWAQRDGDLENLRKDKRFMERLTAWREGAKKKGSMKFDQDTFAAFVKKLAKKPTSRPTSAPASTKPSAAPKIENGDG